MVLLAWTLVQRRKLEDAQKLLQHVIDVGNKSGRGEEVFAVDARNELGWAYNHAGEPHKAIPQFRSALRVRARVYGSKDTDTLWTMHGLAYAYNILGRFADALPLYETVYETRAEVLGEDDIDTLTTKKELEVVRKKLIR
jgi:tetratricopeptide (TPR) repeat protein